MEKGIISSFDQSCGLGMIQSKTRDDVRFYAESICDRGSVHLIQGDEVYFDEYEIKNLKIAINIQKL